MARRGHGEGTIYRRNDGRWVGGLSLGWKGDKPIRKYVYAATQAEVIKKFEELKRTVAKGLAPPPGRLTVGQWLDQWMEERVRGQVRPATVERHEDIIRAHLKPGLGHTRLQALTASQVQQLLNEKSKAGLAPRTVKMVRQTLSQALTLAAGPAYGYVPLNVASFTTTPRIPKYRVPAVSPGQAGAILEAVATHRLSSAFIVAATTGLRQGELLGLRWVDVDLPAGIAHVNVNLQRIAGEYVLAEPKSEESQATVYLPALTVAAIQQRRTQQLEEQLAAGPLWENRLGLVWTTEFGKPINGPALTRQFQALLAAAGLPRMRMHDLRHVTATILIGQGVDIKVVQGALRHASMAVTADIYGHLLPGLLRGAADSMDRAMKGTK